MKDFDLAAAKRGATVCTRNGLPARILCFDMKGLGEYIVSAVETSLYYEGIYCQNMNGLLVNGKKSDFDLMMSDDDYLEKLERGEYDKPVRKNNGACVTEVECTVLKTESPYDDDYWRRMYAGMAMQAFITSDPQKLTLSHAESAVVAADALIEKLKKQPDPKI
ncbi:hypothetical protein [uncultured Alistipes sp.]|uniref:hypothetical protein n=1 Tax=uncultured Alistipes sp. TaxID=538949 RepID=UPI002664EA56|nr:hypothetical protein [uncultured Alistipes sp.]